jgi:hypothetical protein
VPPRDGEGEREMVRAELGERELRTCGLLPPLECGEGERAPPA